jgi:protein-disulfide isomerase
MLFATQSEWAATDDPTVGGGEPEAPSACRPGMTAEQLDACMQDAAMAEALVKRFETNMKADGVEGTPTLFINGDQHSNMSYDDLKALVDAALAG